MRALFPLRTWAVWLLVSCGGSGEPGDGSTPPRDEPEPEPEPTDLDGDGVLADQDCDDSDAAVWTVGIFEGSLPADAPLEGFCDGYCRRSVQGDVTVERVSAAAISCLESVSGHLVMSGVRGEQLPLGRLTEVGGDLVVRDSDDLVDLSGLPLLERVGGELELIRNRRLRYVDLLQRLESVSGLLVEGNPALVGLTGPGRLSSVAGGIELDDNPALVDITGLDALTSVGPAWGSPTTPIS